jgi:hypothetical protein
LFGKAKARANVTFRAGLILSGGSTPLHPLRFRLDGRAFRSSRSLLSPHVVDHEAPHHAAERHTVSVRPRVCASRTLDREREGMGDHLGRRYQPQLVLRLAQLGTRNRSTACVRLRELPEQCARPQARGISEPEEPVAFVARKADLWGAVWNRLRRWRERPPVGRGAVNPFRARGRHGLGQGTASPDVSASLKHFGSGRGGMRRKSATLTPGHLDRLTHLGEQGLFENAGLCQAWRRHNSRIERRRLVLRRAREYPPAANGGEWIPGTRR